jgi:hypothetical protein
MYLDGGFKREKASAEKPRKASWQAPWQRDSGYRKPRQKILSPKP